MAKSNNKSGNAAGSSPHDDKSQGKTGLGNASKSQKEFTDGGLQAKLPKLTQNKGDTSYNKVDINASPSKGDSRMNDYTNRAAHNPSTGTNKSLGSDADSFKVNPDYSKNSAFYKDSPTSGSDTVKGGREATKNTDTYSAIQSHDKYGGGHNPQNSKQPTGYQDNQGGKNEFIKSSDKFSNSQDVKESSADRGVRSEYNAIRYEEEKQTRDEAFNDEVDSREHRETVAGSYSGIPEELINSVRSITHVPAEGLRVSNNQGDRIMNFEIQRLNDLLEHLQNADILDHTRQTVQLFINDEDENSHQGRDQIDLPLILAIAIRESGVNLVISRSNTRIVTAGRDAHTEGRSGLDWVYDYKRFFPMEIREQVHSVVGNPNVAGSLRRDVHPAYMRERDLLAAFIVEVRQRYQRFLRRFHRHEFSEDQSFTETQRYSLLEAMGTTARRAWIQASFGSKLTDLLTSIRELIQRQIGEGTDFTEIVRNDQINLNAIITNDNIMPTDLSRQRTRITAGEAMIIEEVLGIRI